MNQAILLSERDNGPKEYWEFSCTVDENDNANDDCAKGFKKYLFPYLKTTKTESFVNSLGYNTIMYFPDGSLLIAKINKYGSANNAFDMFFYPNGKNFNPERFGATTDDGASRKDCSITFFAFRFAPSLTIASNKFHYKKGFEPYKWGLQEMSKEALTGSGSYSCRKEATFKTYCTALIQLNGWKIPDDYPFRVK